MFIIRQEKEKWVIKLASEGKTTRDRAKEVHISLKDIGKIIRKATGDSDSQGEEGKKKEKENYNDKLIGPLYVQELKPISN